MLSCKNIDFDASLKGVELSYCGQPRMEAHIVAQQVEEAYVKGKEEATQDYNNQILSQRSEVQHLLGDTIETMQSKVDQCLKEVFEEIPALVTNIARRVLADVELDGAMIKAVVDDLISDLPNNKEEVQVYLCKEDFELLQSYLEDGESKYPHLRFEVDTSLTRADCRVVSHFGVIDGLVKTKLKHIQEQLHS